MIKCGKVMLRRCAHMTEKECDDWAIGSFSAFADMQVVIYGYIYKEGEGLYLIAPKEEIARVKVLKNEIVEDFDFEEYIQHTDDRFWTIDYFNVKGPTLQKMSK